jgi:hypothetical protein
VGSAPTRRTVSIVAALITFLAVLALSPAAEATEPGERHCVVMVTGVDDGELITGPEVCHSSERQAVRSYLDVAGKASGSSLSGSTAALAGVLVIGRHYTSTNFSGSSFSILGTLCLGGTWNPPGSWNNNIESSRHYCGSSPTTFYDSSNCSTSPYAIFSHASSLGWMNNAASCVRYG